MSDKLIPDAIEAVRAARGEKADERWAEAASVAFVINDVRSDIAARALHEVAEQVAQAGEPAEELFGDAKSWAAERRAEWAAEGSEWLDDEPQSSYKGWTVVVLIAATVMSVFFAGQNSIARTWNDDATLAEALFPPLLGGASIAAFAIFAGLRAKRSQLIAVLGTAGLVIAAGTVLVAIAAFTTDITVASSSGWWHLIAAAVYASLAFAVLRLLPDPRPRAALRPANDDDAWIQALGVALRSRGDITDERAREIAAEAREHAAEAGNSLEDEFGSAQAYAGRFTRNAVVPARRIAIFSGVLVLLVLAVVIGDFLMGEGFRFWTLAWLAVLVINAVVAFAEWRTAVREQG